MSDRRRPDSQLQLPWVTLIVVIACVGATLEARPAAQGVASQVDSRLVEAEAYFLDHPDLEAGSALTARLGSDRIRTERYRHAKQRSQRGDPATPDHIRRRDQETLDGLLDRAQVGWEELPSQQLGLRPDAPKPAALVSYALLHTSDVHLLCASLLLLLLGLRLEASLGRPVYALVLLSSAVGGAVMFMHVAPLGSAPLVGTSAVIAGALGAYVLCHFDEVGAGESPIVIVAGIAALLAPLMLSVDWWLDPFGRGGREASLQVVGAFYGGGLSGGVAATLAGRVLGLVPNLEGRTRPDSTRVLARATRAREQGLSREAYVLLREHLREAPDDVDAALAFWDVACARGRRDEAVPVLLRVVRDEVRQNLAEAAVAHWLLLTDEEFPAEVEPALLVRMALLLRAGNRPGAAVAAMQRALECEPSHALASRMAQASWDLDGPTAEAAAWKALGSAEISLEERQSLEALLAEVVVPGAILADRGSPSDGYVEGCPGITPIEVKFEERRLEALTAIPVAVEDEGVRLRLEGGRERMVGFDRIDAVSVAAVHGLGHKPVALVDLVLNWMAPSEESLRLVRLRGDRFDPRELVSVDADHPAEALRALVEVLLERSEAVPLPDEQAARGCPFAIFESLERYQRTVLMVEGDAGEDPPDKPAD